MVLGWREGDWKTSAIFCAMKVMGEGLKGGTSFMEDYTYHMQPGNHLVLGAHMLEICDSRIVCAWQAAIARASSPGTSAWKRRCLCGWSFDTRSSPADQCLSLIDLGNRFRWLLRNFNGRWKWWRRRNRLPKKFRRSLRAVWKCKPDFKTGCGAWILAGGAHHTGFSQSVKTEHIEDLARMLNVELVIIDDKTDRRGFEQQLRAGEVYYHLAPGLGRV